MQDTIYSVERRKPQRADTYEETVPSCVLEFLTHYKQGHWGSIAEKVKSLLESKFNATANSAEKVQALVLSRGKTKESLEEKLRHKDGQQKFKNIADIEARIKDRAGVRVILVVPSEKQFDLVREIVIDLFGNELDEKRHVKKPIITGSHERQSDSELVMQRNGNIPAPSYQPTHGGYEGVHYRPKMRQVKAKLKERFPNLEVDDDERVEIQVTTALQHAWAEAGHDITYKQYLYGKAPVQELIIYDALHGLVISGNLLLQELHESVNRRTYMKFRDPYQLELFLGKLFEEETTDDDDLTDEPPKDLAQILPRESSEVLLKILKYTDHDYPLAVRKVLKKLEFIKDSDSDRPKILDNGKQQLERFEPPLKPSAGTHLMICVARHLLRDDFKEPKIDNAVIKCRYMMSALCFLQNVLDFRFKKGRVGQFICELETTNGQKPLTPEERDALTWLVASKYRFTLLHDNTPEDNNHDDVQDIVESTSHAWSWFMQQARIRSSICGLCIRLATEVEAIKPFEIHQSLYELDNMGPILPVSRRSTADQDEGSQENKTKAKDDLSSAGAHQSQS